MSSLKCILLFFLPSTSRSWPVDQLLVQVHAIPLGFPIIKQFWYLLLGQELFAPGTFALISKMVYTTFVTQTPYKFWGCQKHVCSYSEVHIFNFRMDCRLLLILSIDSAYIKHLIWPTPIFRHSCCVIGSQVFACARWWARWTRH